MIVSGKISVKAILKERKRLIKCVYIREDLHDKESRYVERIAEGLPIYRLQRLKMDEIAGNTTHGGYLVDCERRIDDSMATLHEDGLTILCVEGVTDPFNLGEILRTGLALGIDGIITPRYDFYDNEAKLIRASAGASEHMWWYQTDNLSETLQELQQKNVVLVATHRSDSSKSLLNYKMPTRMCLCLGGAYRGLSRSVLDLCEEHVRIDYDARVSLSTVGAATVFAYERYRQIGGIIE